MERIPEPNAAVEFHDSEVQSLVVNVDGATLRLSAYVHRSAGEPGSDPGSGWVQEATLTIRRAVVSGSLPQLPRVLYDASAIVGKVSCGGLLPAPFVGNGTVEFSMQFDEGSEVQIRGFDLRLELIGLAEFIEEVH